MPPTTGKYQQLPSSTLGRKDVGLFGFSELGIWRSQIRFSEMAQPKGVTLALPEFLFWLCHVSFCWLCHEVVEVEDAIALIEPFDVLVAL